MRIEMSKAEEREAQLTAYALGELDAKEKGAVEARLENSAEEREALEQVRETVALLKAEFASEPALGLREEQVAAITQTGWSKVVQGKFLPTMAVAACACLFAAVGLKQYLAGLEAPHDMEVSAAVGSDSPAEKLIVESVGPRDEALGDVLEEKDADRLSGLDSVAAAADPVPTIRPVEMFEQKTKTELAKAPGRASASDPEASASKAVATVELAEMHSVDGMLEEKSRRRKEGLGVRPAKVERVTPDDLLARVKPDSRARGSKRLGESFNEADFAFRQTRVDGERYGELVDNSWVTTWDDGLSTFGIDVDTGTYPNVRRYLKGRAALPPKDAVRIEEMLNYFAYDYPEPEGEAPFSVTMEVAESPWTDGNQLLRVGLKGKSVGAGGRPVSNLVFLVDVSGSMRGRDKLDLLKRSMEKMVGQLGEDDRVGIVTYASSSGVVLEPTHGDAKGQIIGALKKLQAGGSTNGASGITTAYALAKANFVKGGTNRVILATDGDFNVGVTDDVALIKMVEERAKEKIFLTVLGFGGGNLKEARMEQIADRGNGSYHYIDSEKEGEKVLVRGLGATLVTVAKDVKVQLDFNPARVAKYRLIGYANRMMPDEAFDDPEADAGEIGAGHTVTALYEIVPAAAGGRGAFSKNPQSRYRKQPGLVDSGEALTLKLNYKLPEGDEPEPTIEVPLESKGKPWSEASADFRFSAAVAGFGLLLRDSDHAGNLNYDAVLELAGEGVRPGGDEFGLRAEFLDLVKTAKTLAEAKD